MSFAGYVCPTCGSASPLLHIGHKCSDPFHARPAEAIRIIDALERLISVVETQTELIEKQTDRLQAIGNKLVIELQRLDDVPIGTTYRSRPLEEFKK